MHHVIREFMPEIDKKKSMYFLKVSISENCTTNLIINFFVFTTNASSQNAIHAFTS